MPQMPLSRVTAPLRSGKFFRNAASFRRLRSSGCANGCHFQRHIKTHRALFGCEDCMKFCHLERRCLRRTSKPYRSFHYQKITPCLVSSPTPRSWTGESGIPRFPQKLAWQISRHRNLYESTTHELASNGARRSAGSVVYLTEELNFLRIQWVSAGIRSHSVV